MSDLTHQRLLNLLSYDPETGIFTRLMSRRSDRVGLAAGSTDGKGHRQIKVDGRLYMGHRLAWLYMAGCWPQLDIDHINGDRSDNRWCNLRLATESQNGANSKLSRANTSGAKGVTRERKTGRWNAYVRVSRKAVYLGTFDTVKQASEAYREGAERAFGEFARVA